MKSPILLALSIQIGILHRASGFIDKMFLQAPLTMKPDLLQVTEQQQDKILNIRLHIGNPEEGQMTVSDLVIKIQNDPAGYDHVELPGADGQHKQLSCGHRSLDILSKGRYVDLSGTKYVTFLKGCWEMCWREGKPAGTMVCGFDLPEEYSRNAAHLPKGTIYINFPIWTFKGLKVGQKEKVKVEEQCKQYLSEHEEALYQAQLTDNPILQAIHNMNAEAAYEKYEALPHDMLDAIPISSDVVNLQDDLLLTKTGSIMSKHKSGGHEFVGLATVTLMGSDSSNFLTGLMP